MKLTRRGFTVGAAAWVAMTDAVAGSRESGDPVFPALDRPSTASPNYWCSWGMQGKLSRDKGFDVKAAMPAFPGDQGFSPHIRDIITTEMVLGKGGWAETLWPEIRSDLFFLLDDGWDVPYGADQNTPEGRKLFGAMDLDRLKFADLKGTPGQRLAELTRRLKGKGWRGLGLWVSPTCQEALYGRLNGRPEADVMREEWTKKLTWCKEGGVGYLKVDWGARWKDDFRKFLSDLKNEICPEIIMEHCIVGGPLNGYSKDQKGETHPGTRWLGSPIFESYSKRMRELTSHADALRIYDMTGGVVMAQAFERTAFVLKWDEESGGHALVHVEDVPALGAVLGCTMGFFRNEGALGRRAIRWQRLAPAYRPSATNRVAFSEEVLPISLVIKKHWYQPIVGKLLTQEGPAVLTRGLPLPEVTPAPGDEKPFVAASRNPNGALSVGVFTRVVNEQTKGRQADVRLDAVLERKMPLAIFGEPNSVTLDCREKGTGVRVYAEDLSGGPRKDVTSLASFAEGRIRIPCSVIKAVQQDGELPGTLVYLSPQR